MALVLEASGGGVVATLDPRLRILAVCLFAVVVVGCHGLTAPALAVVLALALMLVARMPAAATLRRMAAMDGFIVFMLVLLPFTVPGDSVFTIAGHGASRQGFLQAVAILLKANAVVLAMLTLVGSMSSVTLGHALHRLCLPANLVHLLLFTVRYIDVLHDEYLRLRIAMEARGFRPGTNWHTMRSIGYLVGMMLVRALERSERVMAAMSCRGFVGQFPLFDDFRLRRRDGVFALLVVVILIGLVGVELGQ